MAGLGVIGKDYFGVFPLKGKLLNVREASVKQQLGNDEIKNLIQIIGLKQENTYESDEEYNTLRYGKIICLTDQDVDGSHIKGLLINFFHFKWPDLIKRKGFLTSLATPIVKAFKLKQEKVFYNLTDYDKWKIGNTNGWKIKYYKGLGTSTSKEAKDYFVDINDKLIKYFCEGAIEGIKLMDDSITLAFDKSRADDRKKWLMSYDRNEILKYEDREILYNDFIHKDLKHFSNDDNKRSIPHIMDGLKPSQRKILYGAFLRGLDKVEVKVAQLAGFVSDKAAYHHGEVSLTSAIIGMAQNFVGSNNINILQPNGQFGTRLQGGKDAASPRYTFTQLSEKALHIFKEIDNNVLNNQKEDGMNIEPEYYAPIIPMILVNGAIGIGTGFSTKIPNYNPKDIINNLINIIDGKNYKEMKPYYNKFEGKITKKDKNNFDIEGKYITKKNKLIVTELPVGEWTQNYKEYIEKLLDQESNKKNKSLVKLVNYKDNNTDEKVLFELDFANNKLDNIKDIPKDYHLIKKITLTNMHLFSVNGSIKKYNSIKEIMLEFYENRLSIYDKRRTWQLDKLKNELDMLSYKVKFIFMVINAELKINNRKKDLIVKDLEVNKFPKLGKNEDYSYLLNMPIYSFTYEKIEEFKNNKMLKQEEYDNLYKLLPSDIWKIELNNLLSLI